MKNLKQLAKLVNGELNGDPDYTVDSVTSLEKAGQRQITFCVKAGLDTRNITAGALVVKKGSTISYPNLIYVDEPYAAFAALLDHFFPHQPFNDGVSPDARIDPSAQIGENVAIGPFTYVGPRAQIGSGGEIHANVTIYRDVKIGRNCLIYAGVVLREEVEIGDNVVIQPGAVIGADGFGFTRLSDGRPAKIPQKGKVIIGHNCEIGANTCIDRSTVDVTLLEDYVKLDNLVQIGHNVRIGKGTAMSSQCGISGSVDIGENVIMGGQVGVADHVSITDGVMISAKAGIAGSIKKRGIIAGIPHMEFSKWKKNYVIFRNLDQYIERLKDLEKKFRTYTDDTDDTNDTNDTNDKNDKNDKNKEQQKKEND